MGWAPVERDPSLTSDSLEKGRVDRTTAAEGGSLNMSYRRYWLSGMTLLGAALIPLTLVAQVAGIPVSDSAEIALARGAAPAAISDSADIWVLRDSAYARVRQGTTGAGCLVLRPRAGSIVPVCFDPRAARSVLRAELLAHRLRSRGMSPEAADTAVERAIHAGQIERPAPGAMGWMMSPRQIFLTPDGRNIGAWRPHVMIYMPSARPNSIGFEAVEGGAMFLDKAGQALAHVVVVTAGWADGSRGPED